MYRCYRHDYGYNYVWVQMQGGRGIGADCTWHARYNFPSLRSSGVADEPNIKRLSNMDESFTESTQGSRADNEAGTGPSETWQMEGSQRSPWSAQDLNTPAPKAVQESQP